VKVVVVGGGIGGMALALSLHAAGIADVEIHESASAIKELGVGINVLPHAVRELTELGAIDDLAQVGIPTAEMAFYSVHGQRIWGEPRGQAAGYRWPQVSVHRGALLGVLYRAMLNRLGAERIHTGHHLARFGQGASGRVWAEFVDRASGAPIGRAEGDLLVGCDGVHSVVRGALYPDESPPKWNGITSWRGVTVGAPFLSGRTMLLAGHLERYVVVYPISKRHEDEGGSLINWVANLKTADGRPMPRQEWDHTSRLDEVLAAFDARELAVQDSVEAAVAAYDAQRRPATASVVEANRRGGPNEVLQIVHDRAPDGFARLDDVISSEELEEIATGYHRTAGFDPEILNTRESLSVG